MRFWITGLQAFTQGHESAPAIIAVAAKKLRYEFTAVDDRNWGLSVHVASVEFSKKLFPNKLTKLMCDSLL